MKHSSLPVTSVHRTDVAYQTERDQRPCPRCTGPTCGSFPRTQGSEAKVDVWNKRQEGHVRWIKRRHLPHYSTTEQHF